MSEPVAARPWSRREAIGRESAGVLLVLVATLLALAHLAGTPWWNYLLTDGDSVALPLLAQSVARGEPLQWVMTSQLLLFPEIPLYLVSLALSGGGSAASLVVNAFVNVVVLYLSLRWLAAGVLAGRSALRQVACAVVSTGIVVLLAATEGRGMINAGAFASGILLTTYYSGVVLAAVLCLALMSEASGGFDPARPPGRRRLALALSGLAVVSAATTLSNPLFALQFIAPAVVSLVAVLVLRRMAWRRVALISSTLIASAGIGYLARGAAARFLAVDPSTYLHVERAGAAVDGFILQMRQVGAARSGKVEILVILLLLLAAALVLILAVAGQVRPDRGWSVPDSSVVISTFVLVASVSLVVGQVVTGSLVSRYLLPLAVLPVAMVLPLAQEWGPRRRAGAARDRRHRIPVALRRAGGAAVLLLAAGAAVVAVPPVAAAAGAAGATSDRDCLLNWLDGRSLSGVGSFWTTRALELYGGELVDVQQVNFDFSAQLWMNNAAAYENTGFTYVLVDHEPDWAPLALGVLGQPANVTTCSAFDIYDYAGTVGATELNRIVSASIEKERAAHGF